MEAFPEPRPCGESLEAGCEAAGGQAEQGVGGHCARLGQPAGVDPCDQVMNLLSHWHSFREIVSTSYFDKPSHLHAAGSWSEADRQGSQQTTSLSSM